MPVIPNAGPTSWPEFGRGFALRAEIVTVQDCIQGHHKRCAEKKAQRGRARHASHRAQAGNVCSHFAQSHKGKKPEGSPSIAKHGAPYRPRHQTFPSGRDRTARPGERCQTCSENSLAPQVPGPIFPNHGTPAGSPSVENQPLLPGAGPGPSVPHGGPTPGLSGQAGVGQEGRITMKEILRWMTVEGTNPTVMSLRTC